MSLAVCGRAPAKPASGHTPDLSTGQESDAGESALVLVSIGHSVSGRADWPA